MSVPPTPSLEASYEAVPYRSDPFPQSHPENLAAIATVRGVAAPAVEKARILEIGCAGGGNLVPIALRLPGSSCVGVDLAPGQVAQARELAAAAGAANIEWHGGDFRDLPDDEPFDYIVTHGVFSWISDETAAALLDLLRSRLGPNGVAYVSYNVKPGWSLRGMVRDAMLFHTRGFHEPAAKVREARALLQFLTGAVAAPDSPYARALREETERLREMDDSYLFHEHLELENRSYYFHEFAARLEAHGLRFLAESPLGANAGFAVKLPESARRALAALAGDRVRREQVYDFVRNRTFRQSLVVHAGVASDETMDPQAAAQLEVALATATRFEPPDIVTFGTSGKLRLSESAIRAVYDVLQQSATASRPWADVVARSAHAHGVEPDAAARALLNLWALGAATVSPLPVPFSREPGEAPAASRLARVQAERGAAVTNLRHESVALTPFERRVVPRLDGATPRAALAAALHGDFESGLLRRRSESSAEGPALGDLIADRLARALDRLHRMQVLSA